MDSLLVSMQLNFFEAPYHASAQAAQSDVFSSALHSTSYKGSTFALRGLMQLTHDAESGGAILVKLPCRPATQQHTHREGAISETLGEQQSQPCRR